MKYSVVIVDDHILIAKAITSIIANFSAFEVLYECENGKELQEKFKSPKNIPNIVLLDISMPVMDGFETAKWLKSNHPETLIMALSMQDDEQSLIKMIKNGAKGYLLKKCLSDRIGTRPERSHEKMVPIILNGSRVKCSQACPMKRLRISKPLALPSARRNSCNTP